MTVPAKAILKEDIYSLMNKKKQYAKKHELVDVVDIRDHVAIVVKKDGDWFATNINKLLIQE